MKFQPSSLSSPAIANPSEDNLGWEWSDIPGYSTVTKLYGTATGTASAAASAASSAASAVKGAAVSAARDVLPTSVQSKLDIGWPKEFYDDPTKILPFRWYTPSDFIGMYDHIAFWLTVGSLRADYDGKKSAQAALKTAASTVSSMKSEQSILCRTTGFGCDKSRPEDVYNLAIRSIETAGLDPYDVDRIGSVLKSGLRRVYLRRYGPWAAALGAVGVYMIVRRRRRARQAAQ